MHLVIAVSLYFCQCGIHLKAILTPSIKQKQYILVTNAIVEVCFSQTAIPF